MDRTPPQWPPQPTLPGSPSNIWAPEPIAPKSPTNISAPKPLPGGSPVLNGSTTAISIGVVAGWFIHHSLGAAWLLALL